MEIVVRNIGRRFNREWIFRRLDFSFKSGQHYAVLGPNGSGKSTLLKVLSGFLTASEGEIDIYLAGGQKTKIEDCALDFSFAAPYIELIEEFTLHEHLEFHFNNKAYLPGFNGTKVRELLGLDDALHKSIRYFSSGMKQRVKIILACCSQGEVLILDEPTSNLDQEATAWFHNVLEITAMNRIVLIGSNQPDEYKSCTEFLKITDFKR